MKRKSILLSVHLFTLLLIFNNLNASQLSSNQIPNSQSIQEIEQLIRQMLNWANSENSINLIPGIRDKNDSLYIGIDLNVHQENIIKLRASNFFGLEFIDNYNLIILEIDKNLKDNSFELGPWLVGEYPPFTMSGDANPWCNCQDVPYESPVPWNLIEVERVDDIHYAWKWGGLEDNPYGWKEFKYEFKVQKIGSSWKIASLEGFDLKDIK